MVQKRNRSEIESWIETEIDRGNLDIKLANHVPRLRGTAPPPEFLGKTSDEFDAFLDRNFPRRKFASLRRNLDKAARRKVITPVQLYRYIVEIGNLLHAATITMDAFARLQNKCPPLRVCAGCGRLFVPSRKDQMTCMKKCGSRVRVARRREKQEYYEENRKLQGVPR